MEKLIWIVSRGFLRLREEKKKEDDLYIIPHRWNEIKNETHTHRKTDEGPEK